MNTSTIQLTIPQLTHIFEQLGYTNIQIPPYAQIYIQLEPFQLQSFGSSSIAIPIPYSNNMSPTVESIICSTKPRIPVDYKQFIHNLASKLGITDRQFINAIRDSSSGTLGQLTDSLNQIFEDLIPNPLTHDEVHQMLSFLSIYK